MTKVADLLRQTRSALAEINEALDMLGGFPTNELTLEIVAPLIKAQGELQRAERVLAHEAEMKPRIAAVKASRA
jgi:hypothetical protein